MTFLYIVLAIFIFGFLIFIHELGHFLAARACKVTVHEFSIGMGPKICSFCPGKRRAEKLKKETEPNASSDSDSGFDAEDDNRPTEASSEPIYTVCSLRALPIGGYVSMEGENEDSDDPNALCKKNVFQRMFIMIAGPAMNVILGFLLMFILVCNSVFTTTAIVYDHEGENVDTVYSSEASGLMSEDKILKIGNVRVHTGYEVAYEIMFQGHEAVDVTVERNGETVVVEDVLFPTMVESGTTVGYQDFLFYAYSDEIVTVGDRISASFWRSCSTVKMVFDSLKGLFSGRFGVEAVSGPVGVTEAMVEVTETGGFISLLYFVTVISINLGVMNLLPFPALDGGQLLICVVELVIRRPVPEKAKGIINFAGLAILMLFMLIIAVKDVFGLVSRLFGGA